MIRPLPLWPALIGAGLLVIVTGALLGARRDDGRLHLIAPALPGDGYLVRTPDGRFILVDGGGDGAAVASWLGRELPIGRRTIDLLVSTRADATTLPGQLAAVRRYRIGTALLFAPARPAPAWEELLRLLHEQQSAVHLARPRDRLLLGETQGTPTTLSVLAVEGDHALMALDHGRARLVMLHSIGEEPIPRMSGGAESTVVTYPWLRSTRDPALARLAPDAVVFGELPGDDPQLTLAERTIGRARMLHEALAGRIELVFAADGLQARLERSSTY